MSRAEVIEKALGVTLPSGYVGFLEEYGGYEGDGVEVYGYDEEILDVDKIPCVIGATKILRQDYPDLPKSFISLHFTGAENEQVVLDTSTGAVFMIDDTNNERIADSFEEWFRSDILE
jgi:hypothetical protein